MQLLKAAVQVAEVLVHVHLRLPRPAALAMVGAAQTPVAAGAQGGVAVIILKQLRETALDAGLVHLLHCAGMDSKQLEPVLADVGQVGTVCRVGQAKQRQQVERRAQGEKWRHRLLQHKGLQPVANSQHTQPIQRMVPERRILCQVVQGGHHALPLPARVLFA